MILNKTSIDFDIEGTDKLHLLEKHRLESFKVWPFDSDAPCSIQKMAEAGFYWCGTEGESDSAACFVCDKILDGWEASDDPWAEHTKHAPQCLFVKNGKPEGDYTVAQFIDLFGNVIKAYLKKSGNNIKKQVRQFAEKEMNSFLDSS